MVELENKQVEHEFISTSLEVEKLDANLFRSKSLWIPIRARGVFGGQVISQALVSATECVDPAYVLHVSRLLHRVVASGSDESLVNACKFLCVNGCRSYMESMRPQDILTPVPQGLCCKPGGFHIDPVRPVERALITHGHSDHARGGHAQVWATPETLAIMASRYGEQRGEPVAYGESVRIGEVDVGFVPAGHVLGSAQIAIRHRGLTALVTGDYKTRPDATSTPWAPVPCDLLVTEATFKLLPFDMHVCCVQHARSCSNMSAAPIASIFNCNCCCVGKHMPLDQVLSCKICCIIM